MYNFAPFERKDNRKRKNRQRQKWRDDAEDFVKDGK